MFERVYGIPVWTVNLIRSAHYMWHEEIQTNCIIKTPGCVGWCIETAKTKQKTFLLTNTKYKYVPKSVQYKVQRTVS